MVPAGCYWASRGAAFAARCSSRGGGTLEGPETMARCAWQIFQEAIRVSKDPHATMFWVGKEYAQQGYFAESVDVLEEILGIVGDVPGVDEVIDEVENAGVRPPRFTRVRASPEAQQDSAGALRRS